MDCSRVRDLILQYCSGELDADTRRQIEEHIASCPACNKELRKEEELARVISGSMTEDPPEEYWDDYNAKVRSRVRGITGMLWRTGSIPGCLAGAFNGLLLSGLFLWFFLGQPLKSVHPVWLRAGLAGLVFITAMALLYVVGLRALKKASLQVLPRCEKDEISLKRAIAAKPAVRWTYIVVRMTGYIAMSLFSTLLLTGTWRFVGWLVPSWAVNIFRVVMLTFFAAGIPAQYVTICDYANGTHRILEWTKTHRLYLQGVKALFALWAIMGIGMAIWQLIIMIR